MNTGPFKLNIPLERKNYLTHWVIWGCIVFTVAAAFFSIGFAIVFFASSIVGLPMLLLIVQPRKNRSLFSNWGMLGRFAAYILVFGYIAAAKSVFVPALLKVMRHVIA